MFTSPLLYFFTLLACFVSMELVGQKKVTSLAWGWVDRQYTHSTRDGPKPSANEAFMDNFFMYDQDRQGRVMENLYYRMWTFTFHAVLCWCLS